MLPLVRATPAAALGRARSWHGQLATSIPKGPTPMVASRYLPPQRSSCPPRPSQMQEKYLEQYDELYGEDMHVLRMPLLCEEVRGVGALGHFSERLIDPDYVMPGQPTDDGASCSSEELTKRVAELEAEVAAWKAATGQQRP